MCSIGSFDSGDAQCCGPFGMSLSADDELLPEAPIAFKFFALPTARMFGRSA